MTTAFPVACNRDCGGGCPLLATVEDGRVMRIANNPAGGPFLKGCVRGYRAHLQQQAPDRLTTPLIRTGRRGSGQFREASWDEALGLVASRLSRVREKHGDDAIIALSGSGSCRGALHNTDVSDGALPQSHRRSRRASNTYSSAATRTSSRSCSGTNKVGVDPATLQHSGMIVLWGANIVDCIMGCEWRARVRQAKRRGVPVVVIDPRRTETAKQLGTEWLPVRPGTTARLMLAVLYVLITEGLVDEAFVAAHATGWELLRRDGARRGRGTAATPQWAEGVCGTPAARIVALARDWARRRPTALVPGLSIQRTWGGEEAVRLAIALQVATGNLGRRGGSSGGRTWNGLPGPRFEGIPVPAEPRRGEHRRERLGRRRAHGRAGGHPSTSAPPSTWAATTSRRRPTSTRASALSQALEFSVCHDLFLTATAKHCDVVLPVTHWLERNDVVFTSANYLLYSHKVAGPPGRDAGGGASTGPRDDYDDLRRPRRAHGPRRRLHGGEGRGRLAAAVHRAVRDPGRGRVPRRRHVLRAQPGTRRAGRLRRGARAVPVGDAFGEGRAGRRGLRRRRPLRGAGGARPTCGRRAPAPSRHPEVALPRALATRRHPLVPRARRPFAVDEPGGRVHAASAATRRGATQTPRRAMQIDRARRGRAGAGLERLTAGCAAPVA